MDVIARCRACDATDSDMSRHVPESMLGLRVSFVYNRCSECSSWYLPDPPKDYSEFYPDGEYYSLVPSGGRVSWARRMVGHALSRSPDLLLDVVRQMSGLTLSMMDAVSYVGPSARVLDVGSGDGAFVRYLDSLGIAAEGVDPFGPHERLSARSRLIRGQLDDVLGLFSLVVFSHSLEHMPSPVDALRHAKRNLTHGGVVLVRVPTVSSWAFRAYGTDWAQWDAPRHLTLFSRRGLDEACAAAGLIPIRKRDDSTPFQFAGSEAIRESGLMGGRTFGRAQLRQWSDRAQALNRQHDGDQISWLLAPARTEED